mgnify:FL=1
MGKRKHFSVSGMHENHGFAWVVALGGLVPPQLHDFANINSPNGFSVDSKRTQSTSVYPH